MTWEILFLVGAILLMVLASVFQIMLRSDWEILYSLFLILPSIAGLVVIVFLIEGLPVVPITVLVIQIAYTFLIMRE